MGNSGSTNKIVAAAEAAATVVAAAAAATVVASGLWGLFSGVDSVPNSHEPLLLHSTHSSSGSSPNRHDSSELDIVLSSLGSVPNSHYSGELNKVHSSSGSTPNSHDSAEFDKVLSSLGSVPNSHESLLLLSTHSSSGSSPNRHDSSELDIFLSSLGSVPNSHYSGEINKVHSSSGSTPNSHDSAEFDKVLSSLGSVPNSHESLLLLSTHSSSGSSPNRHNSSELDIFLSSLGSVPNSYYSGELNKVHSCSGSTRNSHDSGEFDNVPSSLGSVPNSHDSGKLASDLDNLQSSLDLVPDSCFIYLPLGSGLGSASADGSVSIGWQFPPIGWVKCNVDGSSRKAHRSAGCGGVYRDGQGKWLCGFARKLKYCNSMKAETYAIYTGLARAWRLGFRQIIIETDAKSAVDLVNKGCSSRHSLAKPVKNARKYLRKEWHVTIVYLPREYNRAADWLSKFAHDLEVGVHELKKPPKRCSKIIFQDKALASCLPGSIAS
ncbi:hypothetical protein L6164_001315 [Bauhinia variegata]|uniref:Uncharacterized protein n=1 Tax=Bauhinia variegata TaxID=167791 RepID=A0ACB9QBC6_BAUVA|nr:hypothetical protein L6164_001315 [Bauhinia variegata]